MDQLAELQRQLGLQRPTVGVGVQSSEEIVQSAEQPDLQEAALTKSGNKEQYRFCRVVQRLTEAALGRFNETGEVAGQGAAQHLHSLLQAVSNETAKRTKLIKLADRSEAGWGVVKFYQTDRIADDSEDEKRINSAEKRAATEKAKKQVKPTFNTGSYNIIIYIFDIFNDNDH